MEHFQQEVVGHGHSARHRRLSLFGGRMALAPALVLSLAAGCVSMGGLLPAHDEPPTGAVCQVVTTWNNEVAFVPDPANGGASSPGLVGRLYLFGPVIDVPRAGDGSVVVDLYDESHEAPPGKSAVPLEEWRIDRDTLHRLLRRDPIGWGYTLFLPWGTYRPEVSRVHLKVRYDPPQGAPLYGDSAPMSLTRAIHSSYTTPSPAPHG
jgi:hypothetical protein